MLRSVVIAIGAAATICGGFALMMGVAPGFVAIFWGLVIVLSIIYERWVYKPIEKSSPGPGWTKTAERFIDDATGQEVTVWLDAATGERKYVKG